MLTVIRLCVFIFSDLLFGSSKWMPPHQDVYTAEILIRVCKCLIAEFFSGYGRVSTSGGW